MNWKTTLILGFLVVGVGLGAWWLLSPAPEAETTSPTLLFLHDKLTAGQLERIEITRGDRRVILEKPAGQADWTLPGKWPVRPREVRELVSTLTSLRSRFTPVPVDDKTNLKDKGLDKPLIIKVQIAGEDKPRTLSLGAEPAETNRFSAPTWLRLDDKNELVRLAPGLLAQLDRNQEYFQQRRLFAVERVAKGDDPLDKEERPLAQAVAVKSKDAAFILVKKDDHWELQDPVRDQVDPEKLKSLLTALPDLWAERFVEAKDKKPDDLGLKEPDYVITVTKPDKASVKLLVGKMSDIRIRKGTKQGPPTPFGPPKQMPDIVHEEYRYAKLEANDQVFEIKAEKLKDIAVALDTLRDPQVARFKTDDARRLEIHQGKETLVLIKDKEKWKLEKPIALEAENGQVNELLDKLSDLRARDKDIIDNPDVKKLGLDQPVAVLKLEVEETKGKGDAKTTKKKSFTYQLGQDSKEKTKLYVRLDGWPRVNAVEDKLLQLVQRPALAYRSKRVLDVASSDLSKIEIIKGGDSFTLEQTGGNWRLVAPVSAEVDSGKVSPLASDLGRLEAVEYVTDSPKTEDLDKTYGLAKPALQAKLTFTDAKKPAQTLSIGASRKDKQEFFARLDNGPVFVVKKDIQETLEKGSLGFRPLQLWQLAADSIEQVIVQKGDAEFRLKKVDKDWKISGPFEATAMFNQADSLVDDVAGLKAEKYVAHAAKNLAEYGLDSPYLRLRVLPKKDKDAKDPPKERLLWIGKPTEKDAKTRFGKLGDSESVFVVGDKALAAVDRTALDFLDKNLLSLDTKHIQKIRSTAGAPFTLEQKKDEWHVVDSPAPAFPAEEEAVQKALRAWANLRAERIADYGPKIPWAKYGLDKPATVSVTVRTADEKDKPGKTSEHVLALGAATGPGGDRYARLDKQDAVAVLSAATVRDLAVTHLDFVNHQVLKFAFDAMVGLERKMAGADMELVKKDDVWKLGAKNADESTVSDVIEKTFRMRAKRIAAYPAKDLKEFGLDNPTATWTLRTNVAGKAGQHVIKIGAPALDADKKDIGERYAQIDNSSTVVVLAADLSKHLVASALHFADRGLASFAFADRAVLERRGRKATFERVDGTWQMTAPVRAKAEDIELDDLVKDLKRLRADELVAEKADPSKYGLNNPQAQWKFFAGDKEVLNLILGDAEKGKDGRVYARLGAGDVVFLLPTKTGARLLDEYRQRKPWESLDAAQVEKLVYQGPTPFTLTKKDGDWHIDGKAELKVNQKAVTETLDALSRLKAQRFVADAKADFKLYGLEPPTLTIEATAGTTKRTLLIGRTEGDSQRYYAATPGSDAVFIISDDDARRIVRNMNGFEETKSEKKDKK